MLEVLVTAGSAVALALWKWRGPILAYLKGRREGAANERARADKHYAELVERGDRARNRKLDSVHDDPNNRDNQ